MRRALDRLANETFDLLIIGGFSLATWLTEKLSNEVTARVRQSNRRITDRFTDLAHAQIQQITTWLTAQAPPADVLDELEKMAEEIAAECEKSAPLIPSPGTPGEG